MSLGRRGRLSRLLREEKPLSGKFFRQTPLVLFDVNEKAWIALQREWANSAAHLAITERGGG